MVEFTPIPFAEYKYDYVSIFRQIAAGKLDAQATYRQLCKDDLFFVLYFGLEQTFIHNADRPKQARWALNAIREVEEDHEDTLDLWAREHLKLFCHETPVVTPSGYRRHGDLQPGDYVYAPSGQPVRVLAVTGTQYDPEMYRITFQNAQRSYTEVLHAGSDHLWDVEYFDKARTSSGRKGWTTATLSTRDLIKRTREQQQAKSPRWYRIKYHAPLENTPRQLPVAPYTLGAWLGDGDSNCGMISNATDALWDRIQTDGYEISHDHVPARDDTQRRTVYNLSGGLRKLELLGGTCRTKYIPEDYFRASKQQRIELLQGLMDTDATVADRGNIVFSSTSEALASGVARLLRSLGIVTQPKEQSITYNGEPYTYWTVSFVHREDVMPFTLGYHIKKLSDPHAQYWYITNIEQAETVPAQCIQVEGGRYLAGEFNIPTHNSTIITYGLPIQELVADPEERICIFSHTRPIAKGFLRQIKVTLESEVPIKAWFPDVFYRFPKQQAPKWSEDDGLVVRRKSKAKEASLEAWGLVDGQPISKHFTKRIYDDVVTESGVNTPEMIKKTQKAYELSHSLGTDGGKKRLCGTHYHFADMYAQEKTKGNLKIREKPATDDGTAAGTPVFLSPERLAELRREQGPYVFSCQQLLKPVAAEDQKFKMEWLKHYTILPQVRNKYLLVDPANEKRKQSDYTVMLVISIDIYGNRFLDDGLRAKLGLKERWEHLRDLWVNNQPIKRVGYEKYGKDADISYMEEKQQEEGIYFDITPLGGSTGKTDRILRLVPYFEEGRFYLPHRLYYDGRDMVKIFIDEEYNFFPYASHDDMLDCMARIEDEKMEVRAPFAGAMDPRHYPASQDLGADPI